MGSHSITAVIELLILMALSLSIHECCHAMAAHILGDDTAKYQGRLTLNPLVHLDIWGSVIIPGMAAFFGWPLIGYARPVQVNPANFTRKIDVRTGMMITSSAGPFANLLLALISAGGLWLLMKLNIHAQVAYVFFFGLLEINVVLMIFNILPIPPLDGAGVVRGLIPARYVKYFDAIVYHPYYIVPAFLILIFLGAKPFGAVINFFMNIILELFGLSISKIAFFMTMGG